MSELIDKVQKARHLSIALYKEVHSLWGELKKEIKAGNTKDLADSELVKSLMMLFSVLDGTCLDTQDMYLALGTYGITKHGIEFINGIQKDIMSKKSIEEFLTCECTECSAEAKATIDDVLKQAQEIMNKALKESRDK